MTPRQLLGQARVHTFEYVPYLASYIYSLREKETRAVETAAIDAAGTLYWNPDFITQVGKEQSAYTIVHECLHLIFQHWKRALELTNNHMTPQDQFLINVAGDLVIEQTMACMRQHRPAGCVHLGCNVPSLGITLDFPANQSMQEYYRLIKEKLQQQQQEQGQQPQDDNDDGQPDGDDDDDGNGTGDAGEKTGEEDSSGDGAGSAAGGEGEGSPPPQPQSGGGSAADGVPRNYEEQSDGTWEAYGEDMAAAQAEKAIAEYEASKPGSVPGNLKAALAQKLRPQPDPFDQLRSAVCTSVASPVGGRDFSHRRRSRKQSPGDRDPLLHGRITVQPSAVVIVDTSGSMGDGETQSKALSVIAQGLRKLSRVRVFCADTAIRSKSVVAAARQFEWVGGGGTDMATAITQVEEEIRPDSIVLVTDAETRWPSDKPRARVVVAYVGDLNSQYRKAIPSWARVVNLTTKGA